MLAVLQSSATMKKYRYMLEYVGLVTAQAIILSLPFLWLRHIANVFGSCAYFFDTRGRKVALANLEAAFGERYTPRERARIARRSYCTFARSMLEMLWSANVDEKFSHEKCRTVFVGDHSVTHEAGQGVINTCFHYSNFEWLGVVGCYTIGLGTVIAADMKNPYIRNLIRRSREHTGRPVIAQEGAVLKMFKLMKRGGRFGIVVDLTLSPQEGGVLVSAFGGLMMSVTPMHVVLAQKTGAVLQPLQCRPNDDDGYYTLTVHPLIRCAPEDDMRQRVQECWDVHERAIHERPECWLWSYKHWRYKPREDDTSRYPFYAKVSEAFEELLARD